jgi:hypothetical protein
MAFDRPIIVLAAPRSGSTLLFETLAEAPMVWTVGGESHQLIEGIRPLNPQSGQVSSNRLEAEHATDEIIEMLRHRFMRALRNRNDQQWMPSQQEGPLRFLEKTPKNALRQPFLDRIFPDALYIYLFRDPRPNISSMMEAWKSGRWVTYRRLRGWQGPAWSLLLPPGWEQLKGHSLPEICAFQWEATNRIILNDLERLPSDRWIACDYDALINNTQNVISAVCDFADLEFDERLKMRTSSALPLSRYTHTPPKQDKWLKNEQHIEPVLDSLRVTWDRCLNHCHSSPWRT